MKELLPQKEDDVVNLMSPLVWAYIGDAVYEVYIRTYLINTTKLNAHMLHVKAIQYVKAGAQAKALQAIHEKLTDKEKEIVRRARNTKKHHVAKNAEVVDYAYATAFEGLIGYLYLTKQNSRIQEIIEWIIRKEN